MRNQMLRFASGLKCLQFIRYSSSSTPLSNSSIVVDSIIKLSVINLQKKLPPLPLDTKIIHKISKSDTYIQFPKVNYKFDTSILHEYEKLGHSIVQYICWRCEGINYPFKKHTNDGVTLFFKKKLHRKLLNDGIRLNYENITMNKYIGLYYIQSPSECIDHLSDLMGDVKFDIQIYNQPPKINTSHLYFKNNEFTLPSIRNESELVGSLLSTSVDSPKFDNLIDNFQHYGISYYRFKIKSSIFQHLLVSEGKNIELSKELYNLLTSDEYLSFLMERIEIFKIISPDLSCLSINPDNIYTKLFSQYISVLTINQQETIDAWIDNHVKVYIEIFNNLNGIEIREVLKNLPIKIDLEYNTLDKKLFETIEENCKLGIPIDIETNLKHDIQDKELIELAKDFINYSSGRFFIHEKYRISERNKKILLDVLQEKQQETNLLRNFGIYLMSAPKHKVETLIFKMLSTSFKKEYKPFNPELIKFNYINIKIPQPYIKLNPNDSKLIRLLLINRHIIFSYLNDYKNKDLYRVIKNYNELIKNFELIGYAYYRFLINFNLMKSNCSFDQRQILMPFLVKKTFKTYVFDECSHLLYDSMMDNNYKNHLTKRFKNDKYLKIKIGLTGFNQYFALLDFLQPKYPKFYVSNLLINLGITGKQPQNPASVVEGKNMLEAQSQGVTVDHGNSQFIPLPSMSIFKPMNTSLTKIIKFNKYGVIELNSPNSIKTDDLINNILIINDYLEEYYHSG